VAGAALGTLAKGPVALVLPGLAAALFLLWHREADARRRLRPLVVLGIAGALTALWYLAAFAREGSELVSVVVRENWGRFLDPESAETGHGHSAAYLLPLALVGLLPWTPILPLALASLGTQPGRPAARLAAAWAAAGALFFSLSAAKRSVYLLPLHPAVALLLGAAVAAAPHGGRAVRAARMGAALFAPALVALALLAGALALGLDPARLLRPWLRPADAAGAAALARAARPAAPALGVLALGTLALAPLVARAGRRCEWRRLVLAMAAAAIAWTTAFQALFHPVIGRDRSLKRFLAQVEEVVPPGEPLFAFFPPDPGLHFYAPRLARLPAGNPAGGHLLVWEDEWRHLRDAQGRPLRVLTVSEARQGKRGHLALVIAPGGRLERVDEPSEPARPPGLRRGSSPP
jgi:4-amino-4-deoxy-L-arabinose transferase-like glycosyltransferase